VHIVLKGKHPNGEKLVCVGYRYFSKKTLFFIMTEGAGCMTPGKPYEMKFVDKYGNIEIRLVERPQVISDFFYDSNSIDNNNHGRQYELALEKKWVTQKCYFRLTTTMIGLNVTDTWMLMHHHDLYPLHVKNRYTNSEQKKVPMKPFAGMLSGQLLYMAEELENAERVRLARLKRRTQIENEFSNSDSEMNTEDEDGHGNALDDEMNNKYAMYDDGRGKVVKYCTRVRDFTDGNGNVHGLAKYPVMIGKNNRRRGMVKQCHTCKKLTTCFCVKCMKPLCYSIINKHSRRCFADHIPNR